MITLVVGYFILKVFGMLERTSALGGHRGICFNCRYTKLIQVINILDTDDCEIPKRWDSLKRGIRNYGITEERNYGITELRNNGIRFFIFYNTLYYSHEYLTHE